MFPTRAPPRPFRDAVARHPITLAVHNGQIKGIGRDKARVDWDGEGGRSGGGEVAGDDAPVTSTPHLIYYGNAVCEKRKSNFLC